MMTNEQLAIESQKGNKAARLALWDKMRGLFHKKAALYYIANTDLCISHGVELEDLRQVCYFAFLDAVKGFNAESGYLFSTFINFPFKKAVNALLGLRTEHEKNEPLNNCRSLDKPLENTDGDASTLLDFVQDEKSVDFLEDIDRDSEAAFIRQIVEELGEPYKTVIQEHFFHEKSLQEISDEMNVDLARIQQYKAKSLQLLRQNRQLRRIYTEQKHHDNWLQVMRWENSPERFALVRQLKEKGLSYGYQQAELYAARERWIQNAECSSTSSRS